MTMAEASTGTADGLFERARNGDQEAWTQLYEKCSPKVMRVLRRKLHSPMMRSLYESTDFLSDVWKSLVAKSDRFDFPNADALTSFLAHAASQKVDAEYRRLLADKRQECRKVYIHSEGGRPIESPAMDPTPSEQAVGHEAMENLTRHLPEDLKRVVDLKCSGHSNDEAANETGLHVRKVQRFLQNLYDSRWLKQGR